MYFKVGEVAARTGLSVRTLHHYEAQGLLVPSGRTAAGHRLYDAADVERLLRIRALRQLGMGLEQIRSCLAEPGTDTRSIVRRHLDEITAQIESAQRLRHRLESLLSALNTRSTVDVDAIFTTLEAMTMFEKYFSPEQLDRLARRREQLGDEAIKAAEQEWPRLIAAVRAQMVKGTDPTAPEVQALARRWRELLEAFSGGDDDLLESVSRMYQGESAMMESQGLEPSIFAYVHKASG